MMLSFARDSFLKRSVEYYGQEYADGIAKLAPSWVFLPILGFALVGGVLGALLANVLIKKHFAKAGVV